MGWPDCEGSDVVRVQAAGDGLDPFVGSTGEEGGGWLGGFDVGELDDFLVDAGAVDCCAFLLIGKVCEKTVERLKYRKSVLG